MKLLIGLWRFWYDFVVGDSATLAIGGLSTLAFGFLLVSLGWRAAAEVFLPVAVVATLGVSVRWRSG